tara:strand:+ start:353 stop:589 length:237 start_codon:yes stop_codon:yes gene_type:complete
MDTLLNTLDQYQFTLWKKDVTDEAAKNLGTIIDCAWEDLEDPDNDVDAGRYVEFQIDEYPALDDHRDAIMEIIKKAVA